MVNDTHTRRRRLDVEQTSLDEASREQPLCKRRKRETDMVSFLADSDDEQDGAEPANGPSAVPDDRVKAVQVALEAYLSKPAQCPCSV